MVIIILMKKIRRLIAIFCLIILYCYSINISNFPDRILIYRDSKINYKLCPFLKIGGEVKTIASGKSSNYKLTLSLGDINVKDVDLKIAEKIEVVPCRRTSWIKDFYKGSSDSWIFRNRRY